MIEINCICCGAELDRHEHGILDVHESMCGSCVAEIEYAPMISDIVPPRVALVSIA